MKTQLLLPFATRARSTFERFIEGTNGEIVRRLTSIAHETEGSFSSLWVYGEASVGKTHLMQAVSHVRSDDYRVRDVAYIPATELSATAHDLGPYGAFDLVLIDDIDAWIGDVDVERALVGLYNDVRHREASIVMTARRAPMAVSFQLADCASRMRSAACYELKPLGDEDKVELLMQMAEDRGVSLAPSVGEFVLHRTSRDMASLELVIGRLFEAAAQEHRSLTVPFVRSALGL